MRACLWNSQAESIVLISQVEMKDIINFLYSGESWRTLENKAN